MPKALQTWTERARLASRILRVSPAAADDRRDMTPATPAFAGDELRRPVSPEASPPSQSPVMPPPARPPAGWYPDGADGAFERWWDGGAWTPHVQHRPELASGVIV